MVLAWDTAETPNSRRPPGWAGPPASPAALTAFGSDSPKDWPYRPPSLPPPPPAIGRVVVSRLRRGGVHARRTPAPAQGPAGRPASRSPGGAVGLRHRSRRGAASMRARLVGPPERRSGWDAKGRDARAARRPCEVYARPDVHKPHRDVSCPSRLACGPPANTSRGHLRRGRTVWGINTPPLGRNPMGLEAPPNGGGVAAEWARGSSPLGAAARADWGAAFLRGDGAASRASRGSPSSGPQSPAQRGVGLARSTRRAAHTRPATAFAGAAK